MGKGKGRGGRQPPRSNGTPPKRGGTELRVVSHIGADGIRVDTPTPVDTSTPAPAPDTMTAIVKSAPPPASTTTAVEVAKAPANTAVVARPEPFRLLVEAMGPDSPNIRVSWCISRPVIEKLNNDRVTPGNARMLLLVTHEEDGRLSEVERHLLDLDTPVFYMRFTRPGRHRIHGFIVYVYESDKTKGNALLVNRYKDDKAREYIKCLTDGMTARIAADVPKIDHVAEHTVDVPREFFAQQPTSKRFPRLAEFWWWFVNLWFEKLPVDQCAFKERAIWSVFVKSWIVLTYAVFSVIGRGICLVLLLLLGRRYIKPMVIWRPFDYNFSALIDAPNHRFFEARSYIWLTDERGHDLNTMLLPLRIPLMWGVYLLAGYFIAQMQPELGMAFTWSTLISAVAAMVAWIVVLIAIGIVVAWWRSSLDKEEASAEAERRRVVAKAVAEEKAARLEQLKLEAARRDYYTRLVESGPVCDATTPARPPRVWDLPIRRWALKLMYHDTKATRCKPYAR